MNNANSYRKRFKKKQSDGKPPNRVERPNPGEGGQGGPHDMIYENDEQYASDNDLYNDNYASQYTMAPE